MLPPMKRRRPGSKRRLKPAQASSLTPSPQGKRRSGQVPAGKAVKLMGPREVTSALVEALRARGEIERATQRFHTYPARLHPDAAQRLLQVLPGLRLLDPFCGGGTILVEGMMAGRHTWGNDLNPVATLVARARTRLLGPGERRALQAATQRTVKTATALTSQKLQAPEPVLPLTDWYEPHVLGELTALHDAIETVQEAETRRLLWAMHSSLVVKYSLRASDTSARRVKRKTKKGAVLEAFTARGVELVGMLDELMRVVPEGTPAAKLRRGDARDVSGTFDLALTSPPYPGTYDYLPLQHLRLAWLGHLDALGDQKQEIGPRRDFKSSAEEGYRRWQTSTEAWTMAVAKVLAPGGHLAIVVGDGISHGRLLEARGPTMDAAAGAALTPFATASIERADPATGLAKREHVLVFRRPGEDAASEGDAPEPEATP